MMCSANLAVIFHRESAAADTSGLTAFPRAPEHPKAKPGSEPLGDSLFVWGGRLTRLFHSKLTAWGGSGLRAG